MPLSKVALGNSLVALALIVIACSDDKPASPTSNPGPAPCTISQLQTTGFSGSTAPNGVGQSFVACVDGEVTSIRVATSPATNPGVFSLGLQSGVGVGAPTYTETSNLVAGVNNIILTTPFPVMKDSTYSFAIFGTVSFADQTPGAYPDGDAFFQTAGGSVTFTSPRPDLLFELQIDTP